MIITLEFKPDLGITDYQQKFGFILIHLRRKYGTEICEDINVSPIARNFQYPVSFYLFILNSIYKSVTITTSVEISSLKKKRKGGEYPDFFKIISVYTFVTITVIVEISSLKTLISKAGRILFELR